MLPHSHCSSTFFGFFIFPDENTATRDVVCKYSSHTHSRTHTRTHLFTFVYVCASVCQKQMLLLFLLLLLLSLFMFIVVVMIVNLQPPYPKPKRTAPLLHRLPPVHVQPSSIFALALHCSGCSAPSSALPLALLHAQALSAFKYIQ